MARVRTIQTNLSPLLESKKLRKKKIKKLTAPVTELEQRR